MAATDDPLLAAWYQAMGFEQQSAQDQAASAEARAQATHDLDVPRIQDLGDRSRTDIQGSMEGRGMLFSGETLRRLAEQRQDEAYATSKADLGLANQQGSIEDQLAAELARLKAQNVQREASSANSSVGSTGTFG